MSTADVAIFKTHCHVVGFVGGMCEKNLDTVASVVNKLAAGEDHVLYSLLAFVGFNIYAGARRCSPRIGKRAVFNFKVFGTDDTDTLSVVIIADDVA